MCPTVRNLSKAVIDRSCIGNWYILLFLNLQLVISETYSCKMCSIWNENIIFFEEGSVQFLGKLDFEIAVSGVSHE